MAHVVFNDAVLIAVFFGHVRFDGKTNFADLLCTSQSGNTVPHRLAGDSEESSARASLTLLPTSTVQCRVTVPLAVGSRVDDVCATVDGENIAVP